MESPLKRKKETKEKEEKPKKHKCPISQSTAKKVVGSASDGICGWLERYIDNLVRSNSFPPQLVSNNFLELLNQYFNQTTTLKIIEDLRTDFKRAFPLKSDSLDLSHLCTVLEGDENSCLYEF